jgi:hypothetical protein
MDIPIYRCLWSSSWASAYWSLNFSKIRVIKRKLIAAPKPRDGADMLLLVAVVTKELLSKWHGPRHPDWCFSGLALERRRSP